MIDILKNLNISINEDKVYDKIYDKLFYGENLPSINKSSKEYIPIFTKNEKEILYKLIMGYINLLTKKIR
ncbi:hypothetical protein [[Clostridium] colinum]|uniref:hypothetical protein n=1 Tax=[Clostridium] colinum TaxID=36835 RepID=UPI0020243BB7|nr:hypothetical protein [[Clostridium] colinum]